MTNQSYQRLPAALLSIAICLAGIWFTSRVGYARLLVRYASLTGDAAAAAKAVEISPLDAQVHSRKAEVLYDNNLPDDAARELELAVSLRPRDDSLWLQLGVLRDEVHHPAALPAFDEAVRLAPYYGHPKWQRGNYLLRTGRYDEAFNDLRTAATSNQALIPNLVDLAWGVSRENLELTVRWAGISDDRMRIALARYLATHGKGSQAVEQFRASRVVSLQARRDLITDLLASNSFREAFEIWRGMGRADDRLTAIHDGDFEASSTFDDSGFGWQFAPGSQGARISLDANQPQTGKQSLLVTFMGYSEPNTALLSQLLLVEPRKRYRVKFGIRTEKLVTGGLPLIVVSDAKKKTNVLGQSTPMGFEGTAWQSLSLDFQTDNATEAVELRLQRKPCPNVPCPIFGSLWLDSFSIEELK
jgi:tetratricopeptide (TPR) repeat protein